jgi:hypothetical protein
MRTFKEFISLTESSTGERHRAVRHGPNRNTRIRDYEKAKTSDKIALRKAGFHRNRNDDRFPQYSSTANSPHHSTSVATYKNQSDFAIDNSKQKRTRKGVTPTGNRVSELKAIRKQMKGDRTPRQVHKVDIETDSEAQYAKNDSRERMARGRSFKKELRSLPNAMKDTGAEAGDHVVGTPAEVMRGISSRREAERGARRRAKIYTNDLGASYSHRTKTSMGRLK